MSPPRRRGRLPSLDALRVFESTARHLSFTKAAAELNVTQSAISHRIRWLERTLGFRLFRRGQAVLELTPAGSTLAKGIHRGIEEIWAALDAVADATPRSALTVSVQPSLAVHWLTPRLPKFRARFSRLELVVDAEDRLIDLTAGNVDASIRFGTGRYPGLHTTLVMHDSMIPVCSPEVLKRFGPMRSPVDATKFPLLHDSIAEQDPSGTSWCAWFRAVGAPDVPCDSGLRFSNASLVLQAALAGLGLAVVRTSLLGRELSSGRLVCPLPLAAWTEFSYYFVCLPERVDDAKLRALRLWLVEEAKAPPFESGGLELVWPQGGQPGASATVDCPPAPVLPLPARRGLLRASTLS